jgi:hypothetical protein
MKQQDGITTVQVEDYGSNINMDADREELGELLHALAAALNRLNPEQRHFMFVHRGEEVCEVIIPPKRGEMQ